MDNEVLQAATSVNKETIEIGLKYIGAGLAALGIFGAALGVGNLTSAALNGIARNPSAEPKIKSVFIIGAAFTEGLGLFSFALAIALLFI